MSIWIKNDMQALTDIPWHQSAWDHLLTSIKNQRLAHSLLITGNKGLGKFLLAERLAQLLLCEHGIEKYKICNTCKACELFKAGTHPDFRLLQIEEKNSVIKIDAVRELIHFCHQTSFNGGYKIAILYPAEALNSSAANALLKTLEEPPLNKVLWLLVSHQSALLLPTIRSRCQLLFLNIPSKDEAKGWLKKHLNENDDYELALLLAEGAPLLAYTLVKDNKVAVVLTLLEDLKNLVTKKLNAVKAAEKWLKTDINEFLFLMNFCLLQIIRYQFNLESNLKNKELSEQNLQMIAKAVDTLYLFYCLDFVIEQQRHIQNKINLNAQLILESIFYKLQLK